MVAVTRKERLEFRVSADMKADIETAAQLVRVSASQFIAESAYERARNVIQEHSRIKLTDESWNAVRDALDNPPAPNKRFIDAVERMKKDSSWEWED